jgi:hypothetical protein
MKSKEMLPQSGPFVSSVDSVSWQAHREAERLDDVSVVPQIEEQFRAAKAPNILNNIAFILAGLIANIRSPEAISLFLEVAEAVPDKPIDVHYVISYARRARLPECRDYVLRHLDTKSKLVLAQVVQFLGEMGDEGDIPTIGALLDSDCHGLGCGPYCASALGMIGHRDGLPYLERAVERHRKARKNVDKDTRIAAEFAINKINGTGIAT